MSDKLKPLVAVRQTAQRIIDQYKEDIVGLALYGARPYEIINTLVRDQGISREDIKSCDLNAFFETQEFMDLQQKFAVENTIAIRQLNEVSQQCVDTAKERIEVAARQKRRILKLMQNEDSDGSYRKEIRNEIELYLKILGDEDKRVEAIKGLNSQMSSLITASEMWPSDDPHSSTGEAEIEAEIEQATDPVTDPVGADDVV